MPICSEAPAQAWRVGPGKQKGGSQDRGGALTLPRLSHSSFGRAERGSTRTSITSFWRQSSWGPIGERLGYRTGTLLTPGTKRQREEGGLTIGFENEDPAVLAMLNDELAQRNTEPFVPTESADQ